MKKGRVFPAFFYFCNVFFQMQCNPVQEG